MANTTICEKNQLKHSSEKEYLLDPRSKITAGQSVVYKALDTNLGRHVCVKIITISGTSRSDRERNYEKAQAEIKPLILLVDDNLNVPQIYDYWYDREQSRLYIVMQWIQGESLEKKLNAPVSIPENQMITWMMSLCSMLSEMEHIHLYHKDIKPENLIIDKRSQLWLLDFGISVSDSNLVEGTPYYRAPEMEKGSTYPGREKVDMFAIGVILYRYYTGKIPKRPEDYVKKSRFGPNVWSTFHEPKELKSGMSESMNDIIVKCMAYAPEDRYRSASDLRYALKGVLRGNQKCARKRYQSRK